MAPALARIPIGDDLAGRVDGKDVPGIDSVSLAAVDHDDLVLANELRAIDDRNDAAADIVARRSQNEIQRYIGVGRKELVARKGLAFGIGEESLGRIAWLRHQSRRRVDPLIADDFAVVGITELITHVNHGESIVLASLEIAHVDLVARAPDDVFLAERQNIGCGLDLISRHHRRTR